GSAGGDNDITLQNPGTFGVNDKIQFDPSLGKKITLKPLTMQDRNGLLINKSLDIKGPGADLLTISGNGLSRVFNIPGTVPVIIADLTIANGRAGGGGAIISLGTLTLSTCTSSGNSADIGNGGAILSDGPLTLSNCTLWDNSAANSGGGIRAFGTVT